MAELTTLATDQRAPTAPGDGNDGDANDPAPMAALRSGVGWVGASMLASAMINYGYTLGLAHMLDANAYTVFAAGQAVLLVMGTMSGAAAPWLLAYEIARRPGDRAARRDAVAFTVTLDLVLGVLAAAAVFAIGLTFAGLAVSVTLALGTIVIFLSSAAVGYLQGEGRYGTLAGYRAAEVILKLASGITAVALGAGVIGGLAGFLISDFIMMIVGCWMMRSDVGLRVSTLRARALWRRSLGLGGVQGLIAALSNIDTVLVTIVSGNVQATAAYQLASTLSRAPVFYSTAVSTVAFREMNVGDEATAHRAAHRSLTLFALPAVGLAIVAATAPGALVGLVAPSSFGSLTTVLPYTAAIGFGLGLVNLYATFFQARLRFLVPIGVLFGGCGAVALGVVLGNAIAGVPGLAVGTSVAVGVVCVGWLLVGRHAQLRPMSLGAAALGAATVGLAVTALAATRHVVALWMVVAALVVLATLSKALRSGHYVAAHADDSHRLGGWVSR